jgi:hypothetical protein
MADEVKEDFAELEDAVDDVDAVVVGDLGERFDYAVLNQAFRRLMDGAELVALQKNRYWRTQDGLSLDVGPFVAALEYAACAASWSAPGSTAPTPSRLPGSRHQRPSARSRTSRGCSDVPERRQVRTRGRSSIIDAAPPVPS